MGISPDNLLVEQGVVAMRVTIIGGKTPVTLQLRNNPALLSRWQTRRCEKAGLFQRKPWVYDTACGGKVEFYYKPNYGQCYAVEAL